MSSMYRIGSPVARALGILVALGASSCATSFEPASTVSDVRILAVQGAPNYAAPGEKVNLTALAVDPKGRKIQMAWTTCLNPPSTVVNSCLAQIAADVAAGKPPEVTMGEGMNDYSLTVPQDAISRLPAIAVPNAMLGVVTVACPGTISFGTADPEKGGLPVVCTGENGAALPPEGFVISVKRIILRQHDRNANPGIDSVTWNGAPWPEGEVREVASCSNDPVIFDDCTGGEKPVIGVKPAATASEHGTDETGTTFAEQLIVEGYAQKGAFEFDVRSGDSPGTKWVARHEASGADQTMWFVLHDDRGGVSWVTRTVHVR